MGQAMMWHLYSQDGDIAPAVGLAHEWGHNVQAQTGVPAPETNEESVNYENQADCIAGAWLRYADQPAQHWLESEDAPNVGLLIEDIASAENDPNRNHGDLQERAASMLRGIQGGLMACNDFYPNTPIYVPWWRWSCCPDDDAGCGPADPAVRATAGAGRTDAAQAGGSEPTSRCRT
jgi:Putative neutral zinc metallopeptidase